MILCIDIGNTNINFGIAKNDQFLTTFRIATNSKKTEDEYGALVVDLFRNAEIDYTKIKGIIISSVVPSIDEAFQKMGLKIFNINPIFIVPGIKSGIKIKLENPKQLGADLLVTAVAAYEKYKDNVIIVDLGTATKLTVVTKNAEFLGGIIAPGVLTSLQALTERTAKLPTIKLDIPNDIIGRETIECIQSGFTYGFASMLDGLIQKIKRSIGEAVVVVTGGLAKPILPVIEEKVIFEEFLILDGLRILYEKNK
jgi:type III pantothenate kinase